jgi:serine protease AprX
LLSERPRGSAATRKVCLLAAMAASGMAFAEPSLLEVTLDRDACADVRATLENAGAEWVGLLNDRRALVRGSLAGLGGLAPVVQAGVLPWDRKLPATLMETLGAASPLHTGPVASFTLVPTSRDMGDRVAVAGAARALGARVDRVASGARTMRVTADAWCMRQLLDRHDILWVEREAAPETDGEFVREFGGANYVELLDGLTGAGVVLEVFDGGVRTTHADFETSPPILRTPNDGATDHGTSVYGIVFGDGSSVGAARGIAPTATGFFSSYADVPDRDAHLQSFAEPPINGAIQSNSWGSGISRRYGAVSAELDDSVLRHGVAVFQSQSNLGSPDSRPEAWAKNVVSVGGVHGFGTLEREDDAWGGVASTGPAIDGRIKPDLVMFNDGILAPASESDTEHRFFTGTSAATPAVAGFAAIVHEMWAAGILGAHALQWDGRTDAILLQQARPSVAMTRALLVNSARPYAFDHVADDLGRYRQGWGTPDLRALRDRASVTSSFDEAAPLEHNASWSRLFLPAGDGLSLRVTLVFADPAGLPMAVAPIVNDLDLRLVSPSGVIYHGNAGLHDGVWSDPGGVADRVNTVENVFVEHPEPGPWIVEVFARRVVSDAWAATPETDAAFALVVSGAVDSSGPALVPVGDPSAAFGAAGGGRLEFRALGHAPQGDGTVVISADGMEPVVVPLEPDADGVYAATMPALPCGVEHRVRVEAPTDLGIPATYPSVFAPAGVTVTPVTLAEVTAPVDSWWLAQADGDLTSGAWEHGEPLGGGLKWDPPTDADGDGVCWLTGNRPGTSGVRGGTARLITPPMDFLLGASPRLEIDLWLACDDAGLEGEDTMLVEASVDGGATWALLAEERSTFRWADRVYDLSALPSADSIRFRFSVTDTGENSVVEAAIDGLRLVADDCAACVADVNGDGEAGLDDLSVFVGLFQAQDPAADVNQDGLITLGDLVAFLIDFESGCTG